MGKPGAGNRAGTERIPVGHRAGGAQPDGVALQLLDDRHQVMRDRRRLRRLRMSVRGKDVLGVPRREIEQRPAQRQRPVNQRQHHLALAHAVHRHVDVVAGAGGVQPSGDVLAALRHDQPFDVEEQVFVAAVVLHLANGVEIDGVERRGKRAAIGRRDDALLDEHHQVRMVNRHERRKELRLGVLEDVVEHAGDVVRRELHRRSSS
jgi:hypothetical protein